MGIKMGEALDSAGVEWQAETYMKGQGKEPLKCYYCPAPVTHQKAHTRERDDKPFLVSAYFRLLPHGRHAEGCTHGVEQEVKSIAKESEGLIESIRDGQYRLRLVMIAEALGATSTKPASAPQRPASGTSKTYAAARGKLPGYINSAKRVLQLRALCDEDDEIAEHLELVFEGNTVVPWSMFYFETERHLDAYHMISRNTVQIPIALHGTVKSKRSVDGKHGPTNVLNLSKPKYLANGVDTGNGIGMEVSVWAKDASWFVGLEEGAEVVILGIWKTTAGTPSPAKKEGKFSTFTTHKLSLNPILMAQIARVPKR
jgi:hypothetical protein